MKTKMNGSTKAHTASLRKAPKTEKTPKAKKGTKMENVQMEPETGAAEAILELNEQVADAEAAQEHDEVSEVGNEAFVAAVEPASEVENEAFVAAVEPASEEAPVTVKEIPVTDSREPAHAAGGTFGRLAAHRKSFKKFAVSIGEEGQGGQKKVVTDCGDEAAEILRGLELHEVYELVEERTGVDYRENYAHLNPGQQRMNLGNRFRSWLRKQADAQPKA